MEETNTPEPMRGPAPGEPLKPLNSVPPVQTAPPPQGPPAQGPPTSPQSNPGMGAMPPLQVPDTQLQQPRGGRGRKIILTVIVILILLGGGVAVAALLFPTTPNENLVVVPVNTVSNTNAAANSNLNTNSTTNTNLNTNTTLNSNANTNTVANVNTVANTNTVSNLNTNTVSNTNTVTNTNTSSNTNSIPSSYTQDTDGDGLNNYLEDWLGTSKSNPDSDGDGYQDGTEVKNSYSPLGTGELRAVALEAHCQSSTAIDQYNLSSQDTTTYCGIVGDILANIQVMATNASFFENLDTQLSLSCTTFGKIEATSCASTLTFILQDYMLNG